MLKTMVELSFVFPQAKFAFMYRNVDDIVASLERVEWYKDYVTDQTFYKTYVEHCYKYIDLLKRTTRKWWFDIHYESLVCDPYFVSDRSDFTTMQCFADKPVGPKLWRNDDYIRSNTADFKVFLQAVGSTRPAFTYTCPICNRRLSSTWT